MKSEKVYIEFLLLNIQAGEKALMNRLLVLTQGKMKAYAMRLMPQSSDADDCVQDAMLVMTNNIMQLQNIKAFHGWMYRILHNRCLDHFRKLKLDWLKLEDDALLTVASDDVTAVSLASGEHELSDVRTAISHLSGPAQSIIFLFYFEGFTVNEISHIIDKPAGTVKSMLFDARNNIKQMLNQESTYEQH